MGKLCKDCKDRSVEPNCHITCESYKKYKKEKEDISEKKKKLNALDCWFFDSLTKKVKEGRKKK